MQKVITPPFLMNQRSVYQVVVLILAIIFPQVGSAERLAFVARPSGQTNFIRRIIYGNDVFVAVGDKGLIMTSPDGVSWNAKDSKTMRNLTDIVHGGGRYVAIGTYGPTLAPQMVISTDGTNWSPVSLPITFTGGSCGVAYGNGFFLVNATENAAQRTFKSANGTDWEVIPGGVGHPTSIAVGAGKFLLTTSSYMASTTNGIKYLSVETGMANPRGVAYGDGIFRAVGFFGDNVESEDGITWTFQPNLPESVGNIRFGGGAFLAFGPGAYHKIGTSPWKPIAVNSYLADAAYGAGKWIGVQTTDVYELVDLDLPAQPVELTIYTAVEIRFQSEAGKIYQLQVSDDAVTWLNTGGNISGTGAEIRVLQSTIENKSKYYRALGSPRPNP